MRWVRGLVGSAVVAASIVVTPAFADETTIGYDNARSAWDANEPKLAPSFVTAPDFGKLFEVTLPRPAGQTPATFPNQIYAQPLVIGTTVVVATEENEVVALDSENGAVKWRVSLGPAWTPTGCGDLVPHIGVTSTPVYDPSTSTLYVSAKTQDGPDAHWRLHALDIATGAERPNWPVTMNGTPSNSTLVFNAATANQRPGLLLMGGRIFIAYASHCDHGPYVGYVAGVSTTTRAIKLWSAESGLANDKAGIWQSGGGLVSDGPGRIFLTTGNGVSPPPGPGTSPPGTLAESVVRLNIAADGTMTAKDFFSPTDNAALDQDDTDLGSGAPIALPDSYGTPSHPHVLLQVGKDGRVFLLDRDNLGGMGQGPGTTNKVLSMIQVAGLWGRPAVFDTGAVHYVYITPSTTTMRALRVAPNAQGIPTLSVVGTTAMSFPYTSGSPVVTSTGSDAATALVWVARSGGGSSGTSSTLLAYPAVPPPSGPWDPIFSAPLGTIAKFISPATNNGRVYVGTRDGRVLGFGRPVTSALNAPPTEFGPQPVGTTSSVHTVTVTVQSAVTVQSMSTTGPFAAGSPSVALPHTFNGASSFTVAVTFSPTVAGSSSGLLRFVAGALNDQYDFSLHGTGTADGLGADPAQLDFGTVSTSAARQLGVTIQNTGSNPATITGITLPGAPYAVSGLPNVGAVLQAQQSVTATVLFTPTAAISYSRQLVVSADTGTVTVPITGAGITGTPHLTLTPPDLDFGRVQLGSSKTLTFVVSNTGDAPLTITKAAPPALPFVVATPISEGQTLQTEDTLTVSVTFAPKTARPDLDAYAITSSDGQGALAVSVSGNTLPWTGAIAGPSTCMAVLSGSVLRETPIVNHSCVAGPAQTFSFGTSSSIHIGEASSPWCLDVKRSGTATGTPVQVFSCNGSSAQQWSWRNDDTLFNPHAGKCLNRPSTAQNVQLVLAPCATGGGQRWYLSALRSTRGAVSSGVGASYQVCMRSRGGSAVDGTAVETDTCAITSQRIATRVSTTLRLMNKCVSTTSTKAGSTIVVKSCTGGSSQVWQSSSGRLRNPASGLCMYVPHSTTVLHMQLILRTCDATRGEKWLLPV